MKRMRGQRKDKEGVFLSPTESACDGDLTAKNKPEARRLLVYHVQTSAVYSGELAERGGKTNIPHFMSLCVI